MLEIKRKLMTGDFENEWEEDKELVERFENSLKSNLDLYFEEEELENIIRFYFDQQKYLKALKASDHALEKFPFSIEIKLFKAQCLIFNDEY
jgi:tetratricopeptide (TPR) repeat protein